MGARISLCMIVKDEERNIRRCLESMAGAVDEMVVVDTGSTDNTCQIARECGAMVSTFPWNENFSDARNKSLELATGDWILYLDADEELSPESREVLRTLAADDAVDGYFIKIISYLGNEGWSETCPDLVFRLFRNRREYRFRGAIHEQIAGVILEKNNKACFKMAEELVIIHYGYLDRQIEEKDKKNRNLKIIQREMEQYPADQILRFHYGVELFRAERFTQAAEELTRAANNIDPNTIFFPKLLRYIVLSYQSAGQPEKAVDAARKGLQLFPDYADLYYYCGLSYLELKQYGWAREYFQRAVSTPEQQARYASFYGVRGYRAYFQLAQIGELFLDYEEALRYYILCLRDNQNFTPALDNMVRIINPRENPEYTKESLEKCFEFCTPQANQMMGRIYFQQGAYNLALEYFERGTTGGPASPEVQLWKAICLIQEQRHLEALRIIDGYQPGHHLYPLAKLNKLFCFWVQGNKRKVRSLLAELYALGLVEDTVNVLKLFAPPDRRKKVPGVTLGPDGMSLLLEFVTRLLAMNELDKATYLLNRVDPESLAGQHLKIGRLFYDYGYKKEAEAFLRESLDTKEDDHAYFFLAEIYHEAGNYVDAEQHYRLALELNPAEPKYYVRQINLYDNRYKKILREARQKYPGVEVFHQMAEEAPADQ